MFDGNCIGKFIINVNKIFTKVHTGADDDSNQKWYAKVTRGGKNAAKSWHYPR